MDVYLVRHGIAVDVGEQGATTDHERRLSPEGIEKTRGAARGLKAVIGRGVPQIGSSPLRRAMETAEIIASVLSSKHAVESLDGLMPGADPKDVLVWLQKQDVPAVLLVGHMPDMGVLASYLISGTTKAQVEFKKAGAAAIRFEHRVSAGQGCLLWLLEAGMLRRLGK